jgi:hypothetical protein
VSKHIFSLYFACFRSHRIVEKSYRFVNAHLTAHAPNINQRISDFHHIVSTLLFPSVSSTGNSSNTTLYSTSHLFFLGDLNFRLAIPADDPLAQPDAFNRAMETEDTRMKLCALDQLLQVRVDRRAFVGLREGSFWKFKCTFKYHLNEVDKYK